MIPHPCDTSCQDAHDPNFIPLPLRLVWSDARNRFTHWSQLYAPAPGVAAWDGVPAATHAVGSRHGVFCYVSLETTGRGPVRVPGTDRCNGPRGLRQRVHFPRPDLLVCSLQEDPASDPRPGYLIPLDAPFGAPLRQP